MIEMTLELAEAIGKAALGLGGGAPDEDHECALAGAAAVES